MTDNVSNAKVPGKFKSIAYIHWAAGLVVAAILSFIFSLIVMNISHDWALLVVLTVTNIIMAVAVGFAVRLTSSVSPNHTFLAAFATTGLGIHVVVNVAAQQQYSEESFGWDLFGAYTASPLSAYVFFFGIVGALVAAAGRRS